MSQAQITRDLAMKVAGDVSKAMERILSIAPEYSLYSVLTAGCAAAIGHLTALVSVTLGYRADPEKGIDPDALMLAALLVARAAAPDAIDKSTGEVVELAKGDLAALKRVGRI